MNWGRFKIEIDRKIKERNIQIGSNLDPEILYIDIDDDSDLKVDITPLGLIITNQSQQ